MNRAGFTLIEVLLASILLSLGLFAVISSMTQSQRLILASRRFELAQKVLVWGEMAHPVPLPDKVTGDPIDDELLNIPETSAEEILSDLENAEVKIELSRAERDDLRTYTFERSVDDIDDEELARRGGLYTIRTKIRWGGKIYGGGKKDEDVIVKFWRKEAPK